LRLRRTGRRPRILGGRVGTEFRTIVFVTKRLGTCRASEHRRCRAAACYRSLLAAFASATAASAAPASTPTARFAGCTRGGACVGHDCDRYWLAADRNRGLEIDDQCGLGVRGYGHHGRRGFGTHGFRGRSGRRLRILRRALLRLLLALLSLLRLSLLLLWALFVLALLLLARVAAALTLRAALALAVASTTIAISIAVAIAIPLTSTGVFAPRSALLLFRSRNIFARGRGGGDRSGIAH
jgi:hypothetical protein